MNDIKRITIRKKLLISFLVFSVLMLIIGSISVYNIVTMQENVDEIFEIHEPFLSLLTNDHILIDDSYSYTLHFLLTTDYSTRQQIRRSLSDSLSEIEMIETQILLMVSTNEDINTANNLISSQTDFEEIAVRIMDLRDMRIELSDEIGSTESGLGAQLIEKTDELLLLSQSIQDDSLYDNIIDLQISEYHYIFNPTEYNAQGIRDKLSFIRTEIISSNLDSSTKKQFLLIIEQNNAVFEDMQSTYEQLNECDAAIDDLLGRFGSTKAMIKQDLDSLYTSDKQIQNTIKEDVQNNISLSIIMVGLAFLAVFGLVLIMFGIIRQVIRSIAIFTSHANYIARGDLLHDIEINSNDEIGDLARTISNMNENLKTIITNIRDAANRVGSTAQNLAAYSEDLSETTENISSKTQLIVKGANDQAVEVESMSKELIKLSQTTDEIKEMVNEIRDFSESTNKIANKGSTAAQETLAKLEVVKKRLGRSASAAEGLGKKFHTIGKINDVITSIADQTNLLALNASLEAARAGEQGRGFAVVAAEVGKLAKKSKKSAEQIDALISEISEDTNQTVKYTTIGTDEANEGIEMTTNALSLLGQIPGAVNESVEKIKSITRIVDEQKTNTKKVMEAMDKVAVVVNENLASTQESAAATEEQTSSMQEMTSSAIELAQLSNEVLDSLSRFKIN